jgi:hypothetical protein
MLSLHLLHKFRRAVEEALSQVRPPLELRGIVPCGAFCLGHRAGHRAPSLRVLRELAINFGEIDQIVRFVADVAAE